MINSKWILESSTRNHVADEDSDANDICMDFSKANITSFKLHHILAPKKLQFLYLQGNMIEDLPNTFFETFPALRRLDLRYNRLLNIPPTIESSKCLEVLLLQDNFITALPKELGLLPRLRTLQLAGNPLVYPAEEVTAQGCSAILSFLRMELIPKIDNVCQSATLKCSDKNKEELERTDCTESVDNEGKEWKIDATCTNTPKEELAVIGSQQGFIERPSLKKIFAKRRIHGYCGYSIRRDQHRPLGMGHHNCMEKHTKTEFDHKTKVSRRSTDSALAIIHGQQFPLGYRKRSPKLITAKVYKCLIQQLWTNQLRCVLESQETVLQKKKNWDTLKAWQQETNLPQAKLDWSGLNMPFDIDNEQLRMINRSSLLKFQDESLEKRGHSKPSVLRPKAPGVQEKLLDLLSAFDKMNLSKGQKCSNVDSSTRCNMLASEIKKIQDLQKAVQALRLSA